MTTAASAIRAATAAMGTRFEIVAAVEDVYAAQPALDEAMHEIEEQHRRLTRFSRDSLLAHIQRTACEAAVRLDRATYGLFETAAEIRAQSRGAFDVALGTGRIFLDAATFAIRLEKPGMQLDLGAIAKGFALDRAAAILRAAGITSALLHGGTSSVVAIGAPPDASAWRVGLARGHALPWIDLTDAALSVSRPFAQTLNGAAHVYDPRNHAAVQVRRFAMVTGPTACGADAWATALAVLGERPAAMPAEWTARIEIEHE